MTKGEKRRFRLFATRYRQEKIYLRLFDELNRQKEYDEEGLREKFREEAGITQFHVVKNYLYRMIMKSLHTFEQRSSPQAKVEDLITDIRLLYERGLFKQAWKVWRQASGAAAPCDDPHLHLTLTEWRYRLSGKTSTSLEHPDEIHNARIDALGSLEKRYRYQYLNERMGNICTSSPRRSAEQETELASLMGDPLLASPPSDSSWRNRNIYYWSRATYHRATGLPRQSLAMMLESKRLYDQVPERKRIYCSEYVMVMGNLLTLARILEDYDLYERLLEELKSIPRTEFNKDTVPATRLRSFYCETLYLATLDLETVRGNFDLCIGMASEIDAFLRDSASYRYGIQRNYIRLLLAYAFFACGDVTSARNRVNQLLSPGEPRKGRAAYYAARELELMIHYELGNHDLLESLERSLRTRLNSQQLAGTYETTILRFFRTVVSGSPINRTPDIYEPTETPIIFPHIDFPAWIEANGTGEEFRRIVQRRFLQKRRFLPGTSPIEDL